MGRTEATPHTMRRAVPGDTRCEECGMTRGAKAHRVPAVDVTDAATVPAVADVEITESLPDIVAAMDSWSTSELVRDSATLARYAVKAHASGDREADQYARQGVLRAVAAYLRPDSPAGAVPAAFRDRVSAVLSRGAVPAGDQVDQVDTVPAVDPASPAPAGNPVTPVSDPVPAPVPAVSEGSAMQLTMSRAALFNALSLVTVAIPARPAVPVLSGVLINATHGGVKFRATDRETHATADVDADVTRPGDVLVSATALTEWLKKLPKSVHTVALTLTDPCTLRVAGADTVGTGWREIPTMPAEDFPADTDAVPALGRVALVDLVAGINATAPAACTDAVYPHMCAISMRADGHTLSMDSTDRYRLASVELTWSPAGAGNDWGALTDVKTMIKVGKAMAKIAGQKLPGEVTVGAFYASPENAWFGLTYGGTDGAYYVVKIRSMDVGAFPPVRGLYPASAVTTVTVDGVALVDLVDQVTAGAGRDEKNYPVVLTFDGATVRAEFGASEARPGEPAASGSMTAVTPVDGPAVEIGFNPRYLVAGIKAAGGGHITFDLVNGFKPAVITPADGGKHNHALPAGTVRHLIMPIRVTGRGTVWTGKPADTAPAPAPVVEAHAYVAFGGSSARRCGFEGCDRGKTAAIHRVPAVEPAATAPAPVADQVDQVATVAPAVTVDMPAVDTAPTVTDSVREAVSPAGDQVDQVNVPAPAVDQVAPHVRDIIARGSWSIVNVGNRRAPHFVPLMTLPAGKLERDDYVAVRDTLAGIARSRWSKTHKGFTFEAGTDATAWNAGSPSGTELVSAWLATTAPAGDQVDAPAAVSEPAAPAPTDQVATTDAPAPAVCVAQEGDTVRFIGKRQLWTVADVITPGTRYLIEMMSGNARRGGAHYRSREVDANRLEFVRKGNAEDDRIDAFLAEVDARKTPAVITPELFAPYAGEIRGCGCQLCGVVASAARAGGDQVDAPARALLSALIDGRHSRTDAAPAVVSEPAAPAPTDQVATVPAAVPAPAVDQEPAPVSDIVAMRRTAVALANKSRKSGTYVLNHRGGVAEILAVKRMHGVDGFNVTNPEGGYPNFAAASGIDAAVIGANVCEKVAGECFCGMAHTDARTLARLPLMTTDAVPALGHDDGAVTDNGMVKWQGWELPAVAFTQASALAALADELGFAWHVLGVPAGAGTVGGKWTTTDSVSLDIATPAKYDKGPKAEHHVIAWDSSTLVVRNGIGVALHTLDQVRTYLVAYTERLTSGKYRVGGDAMDACYRAATGRPMYGNPLPREAFTVDAPAAVSEPAAPAPVDQVATTDAPAPAGTVDQGPTVHTFDTAGEAYDRSQTDDTIADGDVLHVPGEGVVGFMFQAWPVAVTVAAGTDEGDEYGRRGPGGAVFHGGADLAGIRGEGYGASIDAARALAESLGYALAGTLGAVTSAPAVDQVDTVPAGIAECPAPVLAEVPARIVVDVPAPAVVPALAEDSAPSAPAGATYGAHAQRVHVSNIGDGDGYRFHLVASAAPHARALAKEIKPELARMRREVGAAFYVTAPRKTGTINIVPQPGHTVADWAPALALAARILGHQVDTAECGACDRSAALVDA